MTLPLKTHFLDKLTEVILKPGDWICQLFKMKEGEERYFLRLYLNIFFYTKIAVLGAVYLAIHQARF